MSVRFLAMCRLIAGAALVFLATPAIAALRIELAVDRPAAIIGEQLQLTVTATNDGPGTESNIRIRIFQMFDFRDTGSAYATFVASSPTGCTVQDFGGFAALSCPVPGNELAVNAQVRYVITAQLGATSRFLLGASAHVVDTVNGSFRTAQAGFRQVTVSADTLTDTDGDGVSDFNETLAGTNPNSNTSTPGNSTIDVLALYSPGAIAEAGGSVDAVQTRINHLVTAMNAIFADSGVGATFRVAAIADVNADDTSTNGTVLNQMQARGGPFADLDQRRVAAAADIVLLFRPQVQPAFCGLAVVLGGGNQSENDGTRGDVSFPGDAQFGIQSDAESALGIVNIECRDRTTAHEVGHIMGLGHDRLDATSYGTFPFSRGYGVRDEFVDVMGRVGSYGSAEEINVFSDPNRTCRRPGQPPGPALPCGIAAGAADSAHATRSLEAVRFQIAAYGTPTMAPGAGLDIDGNGSLEALTDGLLFLRFAFGFNGDALVANAIGNGATRTSASAISGYIADGGLVYDIDGNGQVVALTDGVLVLRHAFAFSGDALVANAVGEGATRTTPTQVGAYLDALPP